MVFREERAVGEEIETTFVLRILDGIAGTLVVPRTLYLYSTSLIAYVLVCSKFGIRWRMINDSEDLQN